jgi:Sel1 repeat
MFLRAALPLLLLASCASQPVDPDELDPVFRCTSKLVTMPPGQSSVVVGEKEIAELMRAWSYVSPWPEMVELQAAAASGVPAAMFELGDAYELGLEVTQDIPKALELYRAASAKAYRKSIVRLGWCAVKGIGGPVDGGAALDFYVAAAAKDCPEACHCLGRVFASGSAGVARSPSMAEYWYRHELQLLPKDSSKRAAVHVALMQAWAAAAQPNLAKMEIWWNEIKSEEGSLEDYDSCRAGTLLAKAWLDAGDTLGNHRRAWEILKELRCINNGFLREHSAPVEARIFAAGLAVTRDLARAKECYSHLMFFPGASARKMEIQAMANGVRCVEFWSEWRDQFAASACDRASQSGLLELQKQMPSDLPLRLSYEVRLRAALLGAPIPLDQLQRDAAAVKGEQHEIEREALSLVLKKPSGFPRPPESLIAFLRPRFSEAEWSLMERLDPRFAHFLSRIRFAQERLERPFRTARDLNDEELKIDSIIPADLRARSLKDFL